MKPLSRRRFVGFFSLFSATTALCGKRLTGTVLAEMQPTVQGGVLRLNLKDFPALQQEFGSVRVGSSPIGSNHIPTGLFYPVIITRGRNGQFFALDSACTHEGCTVPTYDRNSQMMECPCHGSQYLIDGTVRRGPAGFPLRQFVTHFDGVDSLTVELPDVQFDLVGTRLQPTSERVRLQFIALEQLQYEVWFRRDPVAPWTGPVPFALSMDGPVDQTVVVGIPHIASVFLNSTASHGIYAVALRMRQV